MIADWCTEQLGRHTEIRARIGWRGLSASEYRRKGPFLIAGQHLLSGRVNWERCDHLSEFRYQESAEIALQAGDVILSKDGTIGRVARIDALPGPATLNGTMMLLRPRRSLDYRYLYHFLGGRGFQKLIEDKVSGSSVPHIFQRDMVSLPIILPPLAEQRRIAAVLDTVDEAIAKTEAVIAKLRQVRAGILHDLLTRGLDEHGDLRNVVTQSEEFKTSVLGRIPSSWTIKPFGQLVAEASLGTTVRGANGGEKTVPLLKMGNLLWGELSLNDLERVGVSRLPNFDDLKLRVRDLLFNTRNTPDLVGKTAVWREELPEAVFDNNLLRIRFTAEMVSPFACFWMSTGMGKRFVFRLATATTSVGAIYWRNLVGLPMPVPTVEEQEGIVGLIEIQDQHLEQETNLLHKIKLLKSGLMSDLLSGRVCVPENLELPK